VQGIFAAPAGNSFPGTGKLAAMRILRLFSRYPKAKRSVAARVGIVFAAITSVTAVRAQDSSSFMRAEPHPIHRLAAPCDTSGLNRIPVRCWVGLQFVVLPKDKAVRDKGYPEFEGMAPRYGHPSYDQFAGRTVIVTKIEWQQYSSPNRSGWIVTFALDKEGPFYTTNAVPRPGGSPDDAVVSCFVLLQDLQLARQAYLNKRYWPLVTRMPVLNEDGVSTGAESVDFNRFEPVAVADVLASPMAEAPVRIVVSNASGREGYFDIAMSETNRLATQEVGISPKILSNDDPKLAHNWPEGIWTAIESGKALPGMTTEQVRLSLGEPVSVSQTVTAGRTREQWAYSDGKFFYFNDDVLVTSSH
jgi:hypothetical protein